MKEAVEWYLRGDRFPWRAMPAEGLRWWGQSYRGEGFLTREELLDPRCHRYNHTIAEVLPGWSVFLERWLQIAKPGEVYLFCQAEPDVVLAGNRGCEELFWRRFITWGEAKYLQEFPRVWHVLPECASWQAGLRKSVPAKEGASKRLRLVWARASRLFRRFPNIQREYLAKFLQGEF